MKVQFKNSPTIASDDMPVSSMGMSLKGMHMASHMLRDRIYSDKILAVIREYITNAVDANLESNSDEYVYVSIDKNEGGSIWSCRDHGSGLSEDHIRNIYGMYFESTKSNDNKFIGGLGIGSKSGHAYSDTFYITSYFNGSKIKYACILGAGENGIPVGEIYKISDPEPTNESGLEVSIQIDNDWAVFHTKTHKFVNDFDHNVKIQFKSFANKDIVFPAVPVRSKTIGDYTFNQYDVIGSYSNSSLYNKSNVSIRMGGVIYRDVSHDTDVVDLQLKCKSNGPLIIDVPIGKLTIPISREDIEDTKPNQLILNDIRSRLLELLTSDIESLPKFTVGEYMKLFADSTNMHTDMTMEWFSSQYKNLYPNHFNFFRRCEYVHGQTYDLIELNGKVPIFIIPNNVANKSWKKRLNAYLEKLYPDKTYVVIVDSPIVDQLIKDQSLDFNDVAFMPVKAMKLPVIQTGKKIKTDPTYLVYRDHRKLGYHSASSLEELIINDKFNGVKPSDNWFETVGTMDLLNSRTISDCYSKGSTFHTTQSAKLKNQLLQLGWIDANGVEYRTAQTRLRELIRKQADMDNAANRLSNTLLSINSNNFSDLLIRKVGKNPNAVERLSNVIRNIEREDSTRGRIIYSLKQGYRNSMSRSDLRKILSIK